MFGGTPSSWRKLARKRDSSSARTTRIGRFESDDPHSWNLVVTDMVRIRLSEVADGPRRRQTNRGSHQAGLVHLPASGNHHGPQGGPEFFERKWLRDYCFESEIFGIGRHRISCPAAHHDRLH